MKIKLVPFIIFGIIILGFESCSKSNLSTTSTASNIGFYSMLNGANATPPNGSKATGSATFTYNPSTHILSGSITFQGLSPTGAHIHEGAPGVGGVVIFVLASGSVTSPISFTSPVLDATERASLLANQYYINLHSTAYPDGEIRGQLVQQNPASGGNAGNPY